MHKLICNELVGMVKERGQNLVFWLSNFMIITSSNEQVTLCVFFVCVRPKESNLNLNIMVLWGVCMCTKLGHVLSEEMNEISK